MKNTETKFTPGGWMLDATPTVAPCSFIIRAKAEKCDAWVPVATVHAGINQESNARLIASAPALFEVSKKVVALFDAGCGLPSEIVQAARAALTLAGGGR
jgi:hypothetical protein